MPCVDGRWWMRLPKLPHFVKIGITRRVGNERTTLVLCIPGGVGRVDHCAAALRG